MRVRLKSPLLSFLVVTALLTSAFEFTGCTTSPAAIDKEYFSNWPEGTSPKEVGVRVAENFINRKFRYETEPQYTVHYAEVDTWYGALTFAKVTGNGTLKTQLIKKFDVFLTDEGKTHISKAQTVDTHVFGAAPLEIYIQNKDKRYLDIGQSFADDQQASVFTPNGYGREARYWVDDMYMLTIVQLEAYRSTGNKKYLDRTVELAASYLDRLQQPNGLFFHGDNAPYFWCRGDGWFAAGMAEMLRDLPTGHPLRARIMDGYTKMMAGLLKYQGKDGLWKELIDIDDPRNWTEGSGSAMFTFAIVTGVKNGWLDAKIYGPAARAAWIGVAKLVNSDGNLQSVCPGTGKFSGNGDGVAYYLVSRSPFAGDNLKNYGVLHGNAPVLWSATALLR